ncbi:MAG: porin [Vicinamibacterales bacterium]
MSPRRRFCPSVLLALTLAALVGGGTRTEAQVTQTGDAFTLAAAGYLQFDLRAFPGWDVTPGEGRVSRDTVEVRRARIGVEGRWRRASFEVSLDAQDTDGKFVKDAYLQLRLSPRLQMRAGQFKVPGTRDYDGSARNLELLERTPLTTSLGVGRDIGARIDARLGRVRYDIGLFAGDGVGRDDRAGITLAGRVVIDLPSSLELGGSVSRAKTKSTDTDPANGSSFLSTSGYRFADGVYVQGMRLRTGVDLEWAPGRWRLIAEALRLHDDRREQGLDREDLPAALGTGFSLTVVRRLRTRRDASGNSVVNALLRRPVDLAARYDYLSVDDVNGATVLDSVRPRAIDIRARATHALTLGSTWSANRWLKVLGNASLEHFTDARSAPEANRTGAYLTLGARLQVEWP